MQKRLSVFLAFVLAALLSLSVTEAKAEQPKLVVQITIDALRGDMPLRLKDRFGPRGFRYLMEHGVYFTNVHYLHANTYTAVGHATLATGGHTAQHGMAGNKWYDRETGRRIYSVEDNRYTLIGKGPKAHQGTSPRNLTSSTVGDELVLASGHEARVFSVSMKDRSAIIPGGHLGKAFWYDSSSGEFVTSTYYYKKYPAWVAAWNKARPADKYRDTSWALMYDTASYIYGDADDRPFERAIHDLGRTFPHSLKTEDTETFYKSLRYTPFVDELTLAFAKELLKQEKLGQGDTIDMLAISFSATDKIGHAFGPHSLEYEDNLLRLDATLADLLAFLDATNGLERTLVVLSADHGVNEIPEYKQSLGFQAGRHNPKEFIELANAALQNRFRSTDNFVLGFFRRPSLYLNRETIKKLGLDPETVEKALAEEILKVPGIALAVARTDLLAGKLPNNPIMHKVERAFHPGRSGDVIIVQEQFWYLDENTTLSANHGSPYSYDAHVPIMFAGPGIKPQTVYRLVAPADIAPTLSAFLGIKPPSGSVGTPLIEVLGGH
ncbi:alkaline phosphatase family protein [Nitrospinae bacterium AH-259-F20]|nr:alkaline phosphatase family protein [Nitrospinae bacterium AH-259-F20]